MVGHAAVGGPLPQEGDPLQDLPAPLGKHQGLIIYIDDNAQEY
jgi:hypothetical protein